MWQVCVCVPSLLLFLLFLFLIFPFSLTKEGVYGLVPRYLPDFTGADEMRDKKIDALYSHEIYILFQFILGVEEISSG